MISDAQFKSELQILISNAIREDVGDGDHSSMVSNRTISKGRRNYCWCRICQNDIPLCRF
jgi:hypothetical protein